MASLWRAVTENLSYKLLSVLIALALWFIVRDERVEAVIPYALEIEAPADLVVSNETLPELSVGVAGTRPSLDILRRAPHVELMKVKAEGPGVVTVRIKPEDITAAPGVEVEHVSPATVVVRLESRLSRKVPVRPRIVLDEASPYRVKKVTVTPERVRISGPASIVGTLDQVWTESITVAGATGDPVSGTFAVSLPHPQVKAIDPTVAVSIELEEKAPPSPGGPSPSPSGTPKGHLHSAAEATTFAVSTWPFR